MAHFAKLNKDNIVVHVSVIDNCNAETEETGIKYLKSIYGEDTIWVQTSYNVNIRKNFAGIGYYYDEKNDAFIPPKPYNSWILNKETFLWEAPIQLPDNKNIYFWDEEKLCWNFHDIVLPEIKVPNGKDN